MTDHTKNTPEAKLEAIRQTLDDVGRIEVDTPTGSVKLRVVARTDFDYVLKLAEELTQAALRSEGKTS